MELRFPSFCFFLLLCLSACRGSSPTAVVESPTVILATMPPSPQPVPTFTPALTPMHALTPTPLPRWKQYEIAISQAWNDDPYTLCEWKIFAQRGRDVYVEAYCLGNEGGSLGTVIIFLGPDGEIVDSGFVGPVTERHFSKVII